MNIYFLIIGVVFICVVASIAHELDMRRAIKKYGHTGYAGWLGKIEGSIKD